MIESEGVPAYEIDVGSIRPKASHAFTAFLLLPPERDLTFFARVWITRL